MKKRQPTFTVSQEAKGVFDEARDACAVGDFSRSEMMEMLVAHWNANPPAVKWIRDFEFETKRGRPRRKVDSLLPRA